MHFHKNPVLPKFLVLMWRPGLAQAGRNSVKSGWGDLTQQHVKIMLKSWWDHVQTLCWDFSTKPRRPHVPKRVPGRDFRHCACREGETRWFRRVGCSRTFVVGSLSGFAAARIKNMPAVLDRNERHPGLALEPLPLASQPWPQTLGWVLLGYSFDVVCLFVVVGGVWWRCLLSGCWRKGWAVVEVGAPGLRLFWSAACTKKVAFPEKSARFVAFQCVFGSLGPGPGP